MKGDKMVKLEPSRTLAYVLGVLKGDGSVIVRRVSERGHEYRIKLDVHSAELANSFYNALRELGLSPRIYRLKKSWYVRAFSKEFVLWYKKSSEHELWKYINGYEREFVRGFYEAEGSISRHSKAGLRIRIVNNNTAILKLIKRHLKNSLNINPLLYPHSNGKAYVLEIYGMGDVGKFLDWIKPCIKNKPPETINSSANPKILTCPFCNHKLIYSRKHGLIPIEE